MLEHHLFPNYARTAICFQSGSGIWLTDTQGEKYLDAISGLAVCGLGHAHPAVATTLAAQSKKLLHTSNLFKIEQQEQLAEKLCQIAQMDAAFFCNSGTEANEAAIKLARLHAHKRNIKTPTIIVMEQGFHGRTLGSLAATDSAKNQAFTPLPEGFVRVRYNDLEAIQSAIEQNPEICAVLLEPIQGEGGVRIPDTGYLKQVRALCDQTKRLLILDEVQTGIGRTGHWFRYQQENCRPDILTSAKALGNGMPIGACLAREELAQQLLPGMHGSTFGGNPLACAVALTVLETIEQKALLQNSAAIGAQLLETLTQQCARFDAVQEVRGAGMMLGIELNRPCQALTTIALKHRLLINVTSERVLRLLPPLVMSSNEAGLLVEKLVLTIEEFVRS